jgi:hypothetical protein
MADLNDFASSVSDKSNEELTELLREIRLSRRAPAKSTPSKKSSKAKEPKIDLDGMSSGMAAKLLAQLEGEK